MNLIVHFQQGESGLVSLVGGKGSNLIALTAAGFPVPPGFIVTAAAYRLFLKNLPWLESELANFTFDQPDLLRDQCEKLRARLGKIPLPPMVQEAIRAALTQHDENAAYAVRSSSTFEDLAQAAFAGQHDTYLNIRGLPAIIDRVRDCFVSLWGDRAVMYRERQGFSQKEARMAVAVQQQVECELAGVGFSLNPVDGRLDRLVLDANYGLGESVVAGECEVDHFELDKATLALIEKNIGHKEKMLIATAEGVGERQVPAEMADLSCLNEEHLQAVGKLLKQVEGHYGWPQDIEWGFQGGKLYLFQARPVTTIQPRWTRDESAERFPRPMSPLSWDFLNEAFSRSLPHSLGLMGFPPFQGDWFQCFDHYIYGNQNAVEVIAAFRPIRAKSPQELVSEIPELRRRFAWVLELPVRWARDLDRYLIRLGKLSAQPLADATIPELWRHINAALEIVCEYFRPNIAISMTQAFLHKLLHGLVAMAVGQERALAVVDGLLAGCDTKTAVVNRELHELAQIAARTPPLKQALLEQSSQEVLDRLDTFADFAPRLRRFLEDHGHREMDMDCMHPTWGDQPSIVADALALILRGGPAEEPAETARKLRLRYAGTEHQFLSLAPAELRFFFREMIRLARTYTALDDLEHYQTTRLHPQARRAALALGNRLVERGILETPGDVFYFRKKTLEELLAAYPNENREYFRDQVQAGKKAYEAAQRRTPAWTLDEPAEQMAPADGQTLRGLPGSPGRVTGSCFRVLDPSDFARFPKGAILVARTTNPAWTPLFYSAAGLITESGGPLSHGAVTAREMNLPAVMSVRDVMNRLTNGHQVTVDGTQGVVRVEGD